MVRFVQRKFILLFLNNNLSTIFVKLCTTVQSPACWACYICFSCNFICKFAKSCWKKMQY